MDKETKERMGTLKVFKTTSTSKVMTDIGEYVTLKHITQYKEYFIFIGMAVNIEGKTMNISKIIRNIVSYVGKKSEFFYDVYITSSSGEEVIVDLFSVEPVEKYVMYGAFIEYVRLVFNFDLNMSIKEINKKLGTKSFICTEKIKSVFREMVSFESGLKAKFKQGKLFVETLEKMKELGFNVDFSDKIKVNQYQLMMLALKLKNGDVGFLIENSIVITLLPGKAFSELSLMDSYQIYSCVKSEDIGIVEVVETSNIVGNIKFELLEKPMYLKLLDKITYWTINPKFWNEVAKSMVEIKLQEKEGEELADVE